MNLTSKGFRKYDPETDGNSYMGQYIIDDSTHNMDLANKLFVEQDVKIAKVETDYKAADVVIEEKLNNKIKFNDSQSNFNFIGSKIEQDGLVFNAKNLSTVSASNSLYTPSGDIITIGISFKAEGITMKDNIMPFMVTSPSSYFALTPSGSVKFYKYSSQGIDDLLYNDNKVDTLYGTTHIVAVVDKLNKSISVFGDGKLMGRRNYKYGEFNYLQIGFPTAGYFSKLNVHNISVYNRELVPQEIQYNFQVLNNSESIGSLQVSSQDGTNKNYILASDTDHVTDRTGRTQQAINQVFYSQNGKEFVAGVDGKIEVNNGLEGWVNKADIQGHTVKNMLTGLMLYNYIPQSYKDNDVVIDGYDCYVLKPYHSTSSLVTLSPNTKYTLCIRCKIRGGGSVSEFRVSELRTDGSNVAIFNASSVNAINMTYFTIQFTTSSTHKNIYISYGGSAVDGVYIAKESVAVIEGDYTQTVKNLSLGLNSTQAIISNNNQRYEIYEPTIQGKTRILRTPKGTQNWVEISDSEVRDTVTYDYKLESINGDLGSVPSVTDYIDRARKVKVVNTKEKTITNWDNIILAENRATTIRFTLVDNLLKDNGVINCIGVCNILPYKMIYGTDADGVLVYGTNGKDLGVSVLKSKLSSPDVTGFKAWLQSNPITVRYQLATPIEIPLTDEELKAYDSYKKVILCHKVGDVADAFEIKEDGSGLWTNSVVKRILNGTEGWIISRQTNNDIVFAIPDNTVFSDTSGTKLNFIFSTLQNTISSNDALSDADNSKYGIAVNRVLSAGFIIYRMPKSIYPTLDSFKSYLSANNDTVEYLRSKSPQALDTIVTTIDKSIMPTILTY